MITYNKSIFKESTQMKKVFNFLKTLLNGSLPAIAGGLIAFDIIFIINNIQKIAAGSGWPVVQYFVLALTEAFLLICMWYELGVISTNSKNWIKYKRSLDAQTIDSSSCDCETSNEATNFPIERK
jgi:hypothetical protein